MTLALQTLFSSLVNGSVYALIGVGLVLCYRSSRVVNLAQGECYMLGGILTAKMVGWGIPLGLSCLCGVAAATVANLLYERVILRPRLNWDPGRVIMITAGVALAAEGLANRIVGPDELSFPSLLNGQPIQVDSAAISQQGALLVVVTVVATLLLIWFFRRTLIGHAMTAAAENPRASSLLGVNVGLMRQISFGLAGALGGLSAVLLVPLGSVSYNVGLPLTLNGFAAAAFANMVSPGRALVAGMLLAVGEGIVGSYLSPVYETPLVFGVLLLVGLAYLGRNVSFGGAQRA